jgi:site-specific recombinase XerD
MESERGAGTYSARPDNGLFVVVGEGALVAQANAFLATVSQRGFSPRTVRAYAHDLVVFFRWLDTTGYALADVGERALLEYVGTQQAQC